MANGNPPAPPTPTGTPTGSAPKPPQGPDLGLDARTIQTIQWSAIASAAATAIDGIFGYFSARMVARAVVDRFAGGMFGGDLGRFANEGMMRSGDFAFSTGGFVQAIIMGAIYGAIGGFVLAKFFPVFLRWNKQFLKGWLDSFFKLLFWPTLVAALLLTLLGVGLSALTGFAPWLVTIIGMLASRFVYAKLMEVKVGKWYQVK
ncbi:MAG: hypothetical protein Q8R16_03770 [bacterium]|nr:hypothetical protein [bacterium]